MNGLPERYESAVDKAIREAQERGEFDNLPGKGQPLPGLDGPVDDLWWVRGYVRREGLTADDLLPESLHLRRQLERLDDTVAGLPTERAVREHVAALNRQIVRARIVPDGPAVVLRRADPEEVVARWRAARSARPTAPPTPPPAGAPASRVRTWWRGRGGARRSDRTDPSGTARSTRRRR